jgi:predicted DNA-binding protein (UPF0251 family)
MSKVRNSVSPEIISAMSEDYKTGNFTQAELAIKHGVSAPTVCKLLKAAGVKPEKRKYHHKDSAFADRNAAIVADWQGGASTRVLAEKHGLTHQNISLIIKKAGFSPVAIHRERIGAKAGERAAVNAAAKAEKDAGKREKLESLSTLWKSGATIAQIQEVCGLKSANATQVKIVLLRKKYPDLFPKRSAQGGISAEAKQEKVNKLSALWIEGKSTEECAAAVGWSKATFAHALTALRKDHGEGKFPHRRNPKVVDATQEVPEFVAPE